MRFLQNLGDSILRTALAWLSRGRLPQTSGTLELAELFAPVEVIRDRWGVPHIYAESTHDLMLAQGFVHAQDRLWQMDFQRRLVAGRLAEVLGPEALPVDRWIRTIGLRRAAEQGLGLLDARPRADAQAYVAGVNAFIARGRLPIEFTLLRYRPEPWTLADSLSWSKMMSWDLSVNWESELLRARLIAHLGAEQAAELEPPYPGRCPYIVPPGTDYGAIGSTAHDRAGHARTYTGPSALDGLGSNNWVLAGSRTASGAPLLANDMHVVMGAPSIWYENHLVARHDAGPGRHPTGGDQDGDALAEGGLNVTGVTFPGVQGVVAGHNGHVAWGFTNGFPDVQDLYMERLRRASDGRVQYEFRGEWCDARVIREEIRVRGGETAVEEVVITRHGPIINSLAPDLAGEQPLALRWTSLEPDAMLHALYAMNRARNCLEFREALRDWAAPIQNTVYADTEGNIAYSYPGKVPIRAKGDGRVPVPGWTGEYEWTGYIPFDELPHLYNPPQGYVATANNRVVRDDYPYHLSSDYVLADRAQRIVELIEAQDRIDVDYVKGMHFDLVSPTARVVAGHLAHLESHDPAAAEVLGMIRRWDGTLAAGSPAAAVHEVFMRELVQLTLTPRLGEDLAARYTGRGPTPVLAEGSIFASCAWEWAERLLSEPDSPWFDLGQGEGRDEVMRRALRQTMEYLKQALGPEPREWAWGRLHRLTFAHTLGRVSPLDRLLNRGPYPLGGDGTTLWAGGAAGPGLGTQTIVGPPFRFIADLGDLRHCLGLLAPGNSGHPISPHYDDQIAAFFAGEYHRLLYAREDVEREAQARLHLSVLPKAPR